MGGLDVAICGSQPTLSLRVILLLTQQVSKVPIGHWITVFEYDDQRPSEQAQDGHFVEQDFLFLSKEAGITDVGCRCLGILGFEEAVTVQMLPCTAAFTDHLWRSAGAAHWDPKRFPAYHVAFFSVPVALTVNHLWRSKAVVFILSLQVQLRSPDF